MKIFLNDKYKLLKFLYNTRVKIDNEFFTITTQDKLAEDLHFGKGKVNRIVNELLNLGYLDRTYRGQGSYKLTNKSIILFEKIKAIEEDINDEI